MNSHVEVNCVADLDLSHLSTPSTLIVAFASMDGEIVDQHFGSSQGFTVYAIDADNQQQIANKTFRKELKDGNEDKLKPKMAWLVGCDIVYCGSIGGSATKQLIALGATPMVVKEGPDIEELVEELQENLKAGSVSPQLQRIINNKQPKDGDRFDEMDDDWDE